LVAAYLVVLFGAQPFLGFWVDAIKDRWGAGALAAGVTAVAGVFALLVAAYAMRLLRVATVTERVALVAAAALYTLGVATLEIPQERLHYVEYGVLAALVFLGLQGRRNSGAGRSAVLAIAIVGAIGWLDETLQGALWERRYFDWRDVELNLRAAALGVLVTVPLRSAHARRQHSEVPLDGTGSTTTGPGVGARA
jgi:MFS family permease